MNADTAAYVLGVASLCAIAVLSLLSLVDSLVPSWGKIVAALFADHSLDTPDISAARADAVGRGL